MDGATLLIGLGLLVVCLSALNMEAQAGSIYRDPRTSPGLTIEVNGAEHRIDASPDTPLLYVLRDELSLHGPRFGCGLGQCGACSVLLDGREARSCVTAVGDVTGRTVTTLEGLPTMWAQQRGRAASETQLHPLQQAWIEEQVPQCGYCQSGMIIQAAELLATKRSPSPEEIRAAMDGHLCRCGTYPRIINAVQKAAAAMAEPTEEPTAPAVEPAQLMQATQGTGGALVVGFGLLPPANGTLGPESPEDGPPDAGQLDSWIVINADNTASILTGHQELGQGTATGLLMIAGEELDLEMSQLRFITEDTALTPNTFPSTTSQGITGNGPEVRAAAAAARYVLLSLASAKLGVPTGDLQIRSGVVTGGGRSVSYGELLEGKRFDTTIPDAYNLSQELMPGYNGSAGLLAGAAGTKSVDQYTLVGQNVPRIDIPAKVAGTYTYVHDVHLPGMLHGRVVLPRGQRSYGPPAAVVSVDETSIDHIPDVQVIRRGDLVGVVAPLEWDAIRAAQHLKVIWADAPPLPGHDRLAAHMRADDAAGRSKVSRTVDTGDVAAALAKSAHVMAREYFVPYNSHVPIGPACAIADVTANSAVVYSSSQTTRELQEKIGAALGMSPDTVRVRWAEGSGSYGGSPGRFEVGIAAAVMSQIVRRPVRVQFMRHDEHGWDNYSMPQLMDVCAGVDDDGMITALDYTITQLPFPITTSTIEQLIGRSTEEPQSWDPSTDVTGSQYSIPNWRLTSRTLPLLNRGYLKTHFLRSPIAVGAAFAIEQAIDELAFLVKMDPVEFRRRNVQSENTHPQANFLWLRFYDYTHVVSNKDRWLAVLDAVATGERSYDAMTLDLVAARAGFLQC